MANKIRREGSNVANKIRYEGSNMAGSMDTETTISETKSQEREETVTLGVPTYDPRCREWDEQTLSVCIYPHDAEVVMQIQAAQRGDEDIISWFYEKSRIFILKSVYKLALNSEQITRRDGGSSSRGPGSGPIYKRRSRSLVHSATCNVCGVRPSQATMR
jgi:hypothetical protein